MYLRFALMLLPVTRFELPGWGKLLKLFKIDGAGFDQNWKDAPSKTIRGKWHGYLMKLDLSDWADRYVYFLGRYFELDVILILKRVLHQGDRFVDVGANTGMLTLHSAALVGRIGHVDSFEPNHDCVKRIREDLRINNIDHVRLHQVGLSNEPGTLTLNVATGSSGLGTLATPRDTERDLFPTSYDVPVMVGDTVIMQDESPVKLIKIDVEGFELNVLRGLKKSISLWHPIVVTEFIEEWLARAGASRRQLYEFMTQLGYKPYGITTKRNVLHHRLVLDAVRADKIEHTEYKDVLWTHPDSAGWANLADCVVRS